MWQAASRNQTRLLYELRVNLASSAIEGWAGYF